MVEENSIRKRHRSLIKALLVLRVMHRNHWGLFDKMCTRPQRNTFSFRMTEFLQSNVNNVTKHRIKLQFQLQNGLLPFNNIDIHGEMMIQSALHSFR